jgi:serine/threonine-protein kinase
MATTGRDEGERAFLQQRLRLMAAVIFGLLSLTLAVSTTAALVSERGLLAFMQQPIGFFHVAQVVALGLVWWLLRVRERSARFLRVADAMVTILFPLAAMPMALVIDPDIPELGPELVNNTLATLLFLVVRTAVVPSSALRTLLIHTAASLPAAAVTHIVFERYPQVALANPPEPVFYMWLVVFIAASAGISHVIYGLRRRVRDAMQLGQYRLERKLGEGGMGEVYEASHAMLRRKTAIKLLPPDKTGEAALARFEREVQITSQLTHPNTVQIYDYGRTPDGVFYYAMELLDGIDLERLVAEHGKQPPERVVHILEQVCGALAEAHRAGLIHRDIKPANIVLCDRGGVRDVAKVLDFGLVKNVETDAADGKLTGMNQITGTPLYMAPEAITDASKVDARSDLYALGAVAFYLLTGEDVFRGKSVVEICSHHLHTKPDAPSQRRGEPVGDDLDALVLACLEKDPDKRPQSAADIARTFARCGCADKWSAARAEAWWQECCARPQPTAAAPSTRSVLIDLESRMGR